MFELIDVSKTYNRRAALQALDLRIATGHSYVLIGPSGCGKSTLLRLMTGLIRPDSGSIRFQNQELSEKTIRFQRRRMGYVIQDGGLFPHLTAEENVTLMACHLRWDERRIRNRLAELTELTRLPQDTLKRYPAQISGGQRQRVSLMRALMLDPDVLLLDEPLGALDPLIRSELQQDLRHIFLTLGKTVVLVTHDLSEAGFFGETIVLMQEGRVIQSGSFEELLHAPADPFVSRFINAQRPLWDRDDVSSKT